MCHVLPHAGVQLVATAHGNELENVIKNPSLSDLVGGIQVRLAPLTAWWHQCGVPWVAPAAL